MKNVFASRFAYRADTHGAIRAAAGTAVTSGDAKFVSDHPTAAGACRRSGDSRTCNKRGACDPGAASNF
jgi:hypothetical protein